MKTVIEGSMADQSGCIMVNDQITEVLFQYLRISLRFGETATQTFKTRKVFPRVEILRFFLLPLQSQAYDQSFSHKKYLHISPCFGKTATQSFKTPMGPLVRFFVAFGPWVLCCVCDVDWCVAMGWGGV